jgi:hypothetical protein
LQNVLKRVDLVVGMAKKKNYLGQYSKTEAFKVIIINKI